MTKINSKSSEISLWGRLGVQIDMTPEEFEVLKKNDVAARALLVELIKSDRCSLSGESYFPPEPNEEYISDALEFDIDFQPLQRDDFPQYNIQEPPEITDLRTNVASLREQLKGVVEFAPELESVVSKRLAVAELKLNAALEGVSLSLDPDDIIDAEHLDCFWYDGYIGSMEYKGYNVDVMVAGLLRFSILDENYEFLAEFNNPSHEAILPYIKDDEMLHKFMEDGRVVFSLENHVEFVVHDKDDNIIEPPDGRSVLGDNVLEAFADVSVYKEVIDKIELAKGRAAECTGAQASLEDQMAAAEKIKKDAPFDGAPDRGITR